MTATSMRKVFAEGLGTALLLAVVVGSGVMAERLAGGNVAVALLANTLATVGGLYVLIEVFGPVSGAHFNPAVSLVMAGRGELAWPLLGPYVAAQLLGAMLGALLAHVMFDMTVLQFSTRVRSGSGQWTSRGGRDLRPAAGRAARAGKPRRGDGRRLHRCGVLVHRIHLVREPGRRLRPDVQRQLCRYRAVERHRVRRLELVGAGLAVAVNRWLGASSLTAHSADAPAGP